MQNLLLKNGQVVTKKGIEKLDVFVKDGKIELLASKIDAKAECVLDLDGKYLIPGAIDAHVHFRTPGAEQKEDWKSGSRAAAKGGVTTVFDMPNNTPPSDSEAALNNKRKIAERDSLVNYGFYVLLSEKSLPVLDKFKNIAGVKAFMGKSTGNFFVDTSLLEKAFQKSPRLIAVHAEDETLIEQNKIRFKDLSDPEIHSVIRDIEVAHSAVQQAIKIASFYDTPLHICHLSTGEELFEIKSAKSHGKHVTCETAPHYLFLTDMAYKKWKNFVKVNPPLRTTEDKKALWEDGIGLGLIDIVATDHAPHLKSEKEKGYWDAPAGIPSVELMMPLLLDACYNKRLTLEKIVELTSFNPAKVFGVVGKGEIKKGNDADLVVIDLEKEEEVRDEDLMTKCGWSPYKGMRLHGWPITTIINGEIVYENGKFNDGFRGKEVNFY